MPHVLAARQVDEVHLADKALPTLLVHAPRHHADQQVAAAGVLVQVGGPDGPGRHPVVDECHCLLRALDHVLREALDGHVPLAVLQDLQPVLMRVSVSVSVSVWRRRACREEVACHLVVDLEHRQRHLHLGKHSSLFLRVPPLPTSEPQQRIVFAFSSAPCHARAER
eukprot:3819414-Rhodomonas_salina.2